MGPNTPHLHHEEFVTEKGRIVVWKSADYLLNKNDQTKKETERQEIVKMLNTMGYPITGLHYKDSGQPMLAPDSVDYFSVSHAHGWFALYIAAEPVGIDIEVERPTIAKGKSWFINAAELPKHTTMHTLHLVWGAKEAYYKKCEGQINDLNKGVTVEKIDAATIIISHQGLETPVFYKVIQNAYLVWT